MVPATSTLIVSQRIDSALDAAFAEWRGVHEDAREWRDWDADTRLTYCLDWGMAEDRLGRLQEWAQSGLMTVEQHARFNELLALVERTRPLLRQLDIIQFR